MIHEFVIFVPAFAGPKNVHIVPAASKYVQVHFLFHNFFKYKI